MQKSRTKSPEWQPFEWRNHSTQIHEIVNLITINLISNRHNIFNSRCGSTKNSDKRKLTFCPSTEPFVSCHWKVFRRCHPITGNRSHTCWSSRPTWSPREAYSSERLSGTNLLNKLSRSFKPLKISEDLQTYITAIKWCSICVST